MGPTNESADGRTNEHNHMEFLIRIQKLKKNSSLEWANKEERRGGHDYSDSDPNLHIVVFNPI